MFNFPNDAKDKLSVFFESLCIDSIILCICVILYILLLVSTI